MLRGPGGDLHRSRNVLMEDLAGGLDDITRIARLGTKSGAGRIAGVPEHVLHRLDTRKVHPESIGAGSDFSPATPGGEAPQSPQRCAQRYDWRGNVRYSQKIELVL